MDGKGGSALPLQHFELATGAALLISRCLRPRGCVLLQRGNYGARACRSSRCALHVNRVHEKCCDRRGNSERNRALHKIAARDLPFAKRLVKPPQLALTSTV